MSDSYERIVPQPLPTIEQLADRASAARESLRDANVDYQLAMTGYALSLKRRVGETVSFSGQPQWYVFDPAEVYKNDEDTVASKSRFRRKGEAHDKPKMVGVPCYSMLDEECEPRQFEDAKLLDVYEEYENSGKWIVRVASNGNSYYEVPLTTVENLRLQTTEAVEA